MNHLQNEQSLYLLQHAQNPVNWYAWGDTPFQIAQNENKPVLISIGYAACHWCHVMEHENFENTAVAAYMNQHFICIKVDKEEHPAVDQYYMDALQTLTGTGGWPLNIFTTADRLPFYGGTYFPSVQTQNRISWLALLKQIHRIWEEENEKIQNQAYNLNAHLKAQNENILQFQNQKIENNVIEDAVEKIMQNFDSQAGGFGHQPKFPALMTIQFLLENYELNKNQKALHAALKSIDALITGGIYDQLGGGIARYATDKNWLIPHFEKMLYDNALLISILCKAFLITNIEKYKSYATFTVDFLFREMYDGAAFYASIDADSDGEEGKFYTFSWSEIESIIFEKELPIIAFYWGLTPEGNWEEKNIFTQKKSIEETAQYFDKSIIEIEKIIENSRNAFLNFRNKRARPNTDEKILLAWNALINSALVEYAKIDHSYFKVAQTHLNVLINTFFKNEVLLHNKNKGIVRIGADLADYSYFIQALLSYSIATQDPSFLSIIEKLLQLTNLHFSDENNLFFYFNSNLNNEIPIRKVDLNDHAIPSANAVMAACLIQFGLMQEQQEYIERGTCLIDQLAPTIAAYPLSHSYWATLFQRQNAGWKTWIVAGENATIIFEKIKNKLPPNYFLMKTESQQKDNFKVLMERKIAAKTMVYICDLYQCNPPFEVHINTLNQLLEKIT